MTEHKRRRTDAEYAEMSREIETGQHTAAGPIDYQDHCGRCGRPDNEHGDHPDDGPSYCGWTRAMVQEHRNNPPPPT